MKRLLFLFVAFCECAFSFVNAQDKDIHVYLKNGEIHSFFYSKANSLTFENAEKQVVTTEDSIYSVAVSEVEKVRFGGRELPLAIYEENFAGWSEMLISNTGFAAFHKDKDINHPERAFLMIPDEEYGIICSYMVFDEQSIPRLITFNDNVLYLSQGEKNILNCIYIEGDSLATQFVLNDNDTDKIGKFQNRSFTENNWQRNTIALAKILIGVINVAIGTTLFVGSVVSAVGTAGVSSPISIPGASLGIISTWSGQSTLQSGLSTLWVPAAENSKGFDQYTNEAIAGTVYGQCAESIASSKKASDFLGSLPAGAQKYLTEPKIKKSGWLFAAELTLEALDAKFGETITKADRIKAFYDKGIVLTFPYNDVTSNSAVVSGFISRIIAKGYSEDADVECGIAVTGNHKNYSQKGYPGPDDILKFKLENLEPGQTYTYRAYLWDRTNAILLMGSDYSFTTLPSLPKIVSFQQLSSEYKPQAFENNGKYYSYKFHCATTVEIEDDNNVEDWGYVYVDKLEGEKRFSLKDFGKSYRDSRWAYYRNQSPDFVTFYTYVKYKNNVESVGRRAENTSNDGYYYSEPVDFELLYHDLLFSCPDDKHPHMIDLGLPSGTKWACCNVGASSPGEFGGYYAWGELQEKELYIPHTYEYAVDDSEGGIWLDEITNTYKRVIDIGSDIAGTQYDVAHVSWGGNWKMPSKSQFEELVKYSRIFRNTNCGLSFVGPNGNCIELPSAGFVSYDGTRGAGYCDWGHYWTSSSANDYYNQWAYMMRFWFAWDGYVKILYQTRYNGFSVRPVTK